MARQWLARRERGSPLLIRLITWITLHLGRPVGRALLPPICLYFILFSGGTRRASRDYLRRVLGRTPRGIDLYRHYHTFAATLLDRVYLLAGRRDCFEIEVHGLEQLEATVARGRGCFLLGSHLGSFELLRVLGVEQLKVPLRVLMHQQTSQRINAILSALNPSLEETIIPVGGAGALLAVRDTVEQGGIIGILGDRLVEEDKQVRCDFLGAPATFPAGPLLVAGLLEAPVLLFFALYRGGRRYEIHFEPFAEQIPLTRGDRLGALAPWVERYAERLAERCREAPYNWFNFYEFWHPPAGVPAPTPQVEAATQIPATVVVPPHAESQER